MLLATAFLMISRSQGGDVSTRDVVMSTMSGVIIAMLMGIRPR